MSKNSKIIKNGGFLIPFLMLLAAILLFPLPGRAASPLEEAWQELLQTPLTSVDRLRPAVREFIRVQHASHLTNASIYSQALLELANRPQLPDPVKIELARSAVEISPDLAFPETALSKILFRSGHYLQSFRVFLKAAGKFRNSRMESYYASTFFWLAMAFLPLSLLLLTTLLLVARYYRTVSETGRLKLNRLGNLTLLATGTTVSLLVILIPAPLPGLLLLALVLATLATRRDNLLLTIIMTSLLAVPYAYEKGMLSLLALDSSFFKVSQQNLSGLGPDHDKIVLRQPASNRSQLVLQLFSQAEAARLRKEYQQAAIFLEKIIAKQVSLAAVYNNLGNLYLLLDQPEKSIPLYRKAISLRKKFGIPYYNLSQAYLRVSFDLNESAKALETALRLSPELNRREESRDNLEPTMEMELVFLPLPKDFYQRYADEQSGIETFLPEFMGKLIFPGAGRTSYFILVLATLGGLLFLTVKTPAERRICLACGRMFHLPPSAGRQVLCPLCRPRPTAYGAASGGIENRLAISTVVGCLLPGYYQFTSNRQFYAMLFFIPLLLWVYNILICRTGILDPFPPSSAWLQAVLPIFIWGINLAVLVWLRYRDQRRWSANWNARRSL